MHFQGGFMFYRCSKAKSRLCPKMIFITPKRCFLLQFKENLQIKGIRHCDPDGYRELQSPGRYAYAIEGMLPTSKRLPPFGRKDASLRCVGDFSNTSLVVKYCSFWRVCAYLLLSASASY